jgi:hypothetical protein
VSAWVLRGPTGDERARGTYAECVAAAEDIWPGSYEAESIGDDGQDARRRRRRRRRLRRRGRVPLMGGASG